LAVFNDNDVRPRAPKRKLTFPVCSRHVSITTVSPSGAIPSPNSSGARGARFCTATVQPTCSWAMIVRIASIKRHTQPRASGHPTTRARAHIHTHTHTHAHAHAHTHTHTYIHIHTHTHTHTHHDCQHMQNHRHRHRHRHRHQHQRHTCTTTTSTLCCTPIHVCAARQHSPAPSTGSTIRMSDAPYIPVDSYRRPRWMERPCVKADGSCCTECSSRSPSTCVASARITDTTQSVRSSLGKKTKYSREKTKQRTPSDCLQATQSRTACGRCVVGENVLVISRRTTGSEPQPPSLNRGQTNGMFGIFTHELNSQKSTRSSTHNTCTAGQQPCRCTSMCSAAGDGEG
jgi:hypothetical protein